MDERTHALAFRTIVDESFGPRTVVLNDGCSAEVICVIASTARSDLVVSVAPWVKNLLALHAMDHNAAVERIADAVRQAVVRELRETAGPRGEGN